MSLTSAYIKSLAAGYSHARSLTSAHIKSLAAGYSHAMSLTSAYIKSLAAGHSHARSLTSAHIKSLAAGHSHAMSLTSAHIKSLTAGYAHARSLAATDHALLYFFFKWDKLCTAELDTVGSSSVHKIGSVGINLSIFPNKLHIYRHAFSKLIKIISLFRCYLNKIPTRRKWVRKVLHQLHVPVNIQIIFPRKSVIISYIKIAVSCHNRKHL